MREAGYNSVDLRDPWVGSVIVRRTEQRPARKKVPPKIAEKIAQPATVDNSRHRGALWLLRESYLRQAVHHVERLHTSLA